MSILARTDPDIHLWLHGANLAPQPQAFQERFTELLGKTGGSVTFAGGYDHGNLARHMANVDWVVVPSLWWENSPLVIHEAFQYGRPVICSSIGGMAEKVTHGVNGIHVRPGDAVSLAEAIRYAVTKPGMWEQLKAGIPPVYSMDEHVASLSATYRQLLARPREDAVVAAAGAG
jgi:glycosyltransferase involved in cell wall biosynthesis